MISPQTNIILLKSPLQLSNKHQITFANATAQFNYFNSLPKLVEDEAMYQRKDNVIRFPAHAESLQHYNYCMYQNENYSNKWFYAFITNIAYVNDNCSFISIKTDTFQTWQFDLDYKQSFIEREMLSTNDDVPGANLVPESLETGEYKIGGTASFDDLEAVNIIAYTGEKFPNIPYPSQALGEMDLYQSAYFVNRNSFLRSFYYMCR